MKKKIIYALFLILFVFAAPACQKTCNFCKIVTRDSGGAEVNSGSETQYCGTDLIAFKASNPTITNPVNGNVTKVECR